MLSRCFLLAWTGMWGVYTINASARGENIWKIVSDILVSSEPDKRPDQD